MFKKVIKMSSILLAISLVMALLLAVTNEMTKGIIASQKTEKKMRAMSEVMAADNYNILSDESKDYELYEARLFNKTVGHIVSLSEYGYGGAISLVIGIKDGHVTNVSITDMSETPGLGERAKEPEFLDGFKDATGQVKLAKEGGTIQAISGATITSKAVTAGVNRALEIVSGYAGGASNE